MTPQTGFIVIALIGLIVAFGFIIALWRGLSATTGAHGRLAEEFLFLKKRQNTISEELRDIDYRVGKHLKTDEHYWGFIGDNIQSLNSRITVMRENIAEHREDILKLYNRTDTVRDVVSDLIHYLHDMQDTVVANADATVENDNRITAMNEKVQELSDVTEAIANDLHSKIVQLSHAGEIEFSLDSNENVVGYKRIKSRKKTAKKESK